MVSGEVGALLVTTTAAQTGASDTGVNRMVSVTDSPGGIANAVGLAANAASADVPVKSAEGGSFIDEIMRARIHDP